MQRNPQEAFDHAIKKGVLSSNPNAGNFAGRYMYMGTDPDRMNTFQYMVDKFKHIDTRRYVMCQFDG